MNNPYCPKHEWPAGMGQRCPDCIEIEFLKAEIMKNRTERDAALLQIDEMKKAIRALVADRAWRANHPNPEIRLGLYADTLVHLESFLIEKPESDCTCLFLLNGIHATGCPKCTGEPGVIPVDTEKRNDESNLCGVFVGGMGPCIAPVPCQVHPEKRPGLARICTCTGQGHTDECELAHKRIDDKLPCGCPSKDGPNCHLTMCCERTKGLDH